jgi:hypothetical protein
LQTHTATHGSARIATKETRTIGGYQREWRKASPAASLRACPSAEQRYMTPKSQDHNAEDAGQHDNNMKIDNNHNRQAMQQPDARAPEAFDSSAMALLSQTTVTSQRVSTEGRLRAEQLTSTSQ